MSTYDRTFLKTGYLHVLIGNQAPHRLGIRLIGVYKSMMQTPKAPGKVTLACNPSGGIKVVENVSLMEFEFRWLLAGCFSVEGSAPSLGGL